jgi:hypothetical protein
MRQRSWWWRCLRLAFAIWLAFAIMRAMKRPTMLIVGLCFAPLTSALPLRPGYCRQYSWAP